MSNLPTARQAEILEAQFSGTMELRLYTTLPKEDLTAEPGVELSATGYAAAASTWSTATAAAPVKILDADVTIGPNSSGSDWAEVAGWVLTRDGDVVTWGELYGGLTVADGQSVPFKKGAIKVKVA